MGAWIEGSGQQDAIEAEFQGCDCVLWNCWGVIHTGGDKATHEWRKKSPTIAIFEFQYRIKEGRKDTKLYEAILGLEPPWVVADVQLKTAEVEVVAKSRRLPCPVCSKDCPVYDSSPRQWRHLDTCQFQTLLSADVPRIKCPEHGVKRVQVPWADRHSKFTALFEMEVISWLQVTSLSAVAKLFVLSWNVVAGIQRRAVRRGLKRRVFEEGGLVLPKHLGIDEKSFKKGHDYVTVICDQVGGHVVHVADGRHTSTVAEYLESFDEASRASVETVSMDMWQAYISAVEMWIPDADKKICFDKFHVAQHLSKRVDQVRRAEHKALKAQGDTSLKGTRYQWLRSANTRTRRHMAELAKLKSVALKTSRAWAIKELGMDAWRYRSRGWARKALAKWYGWAIRSRLEPMKKVAKTIKNHLEGIVNAIYHGVTNARSESINSRIQWVKYTARGFRNRERFRSAIYFHLGGLDMTPETLKPIRLHTS